MFTFAILLGIYSYILFSLGVFGLLYKSWIVLFTLIFLALIALNFKERLIKIKFIPLTFSPLFLLVLIQALVNFIGVLGPELGFDALWYHLTLPKIFLDSHSLLHIPGGLLYYSDMPKLTEMIYLLPLSVTSEIGAKIIHFSFGILILLAIYKLSRKFLNQKFSLLSSLIFYSSLVVGWQSTTAYIDLSRTFFELMAVWGFVNWYETKGSPRIKRGWFIESAVMLGLAISTKILSIGSIFVFLFLLFYVYKLSRKFLNQAILFIFISFYIALPWFLFSFLNTGNPIYPLFTAYLKDPVNLNPLKILNLFTHSNDPISPVYIIFIPFIFLYFNKFSGVFKILTVYLALSLIVWYLIPVPESRYFLPYLPVFSIIISYLIFTFMKDKIIHSLSISVIIFVSLISIFYRGIANYKYLPVILGLETKDKFLTDHLNFNYGDFYDTDGFFRKHINKSDRVLLYGFHNLYYLDFPFLDSSYVKKGDKFNYIAVQRADLPKRFGFWKQIYSNQKTHVNLYFLGGQEWAY